MDTIRRGNAAEAAVLNALIRADLFVLVPFGEGCPYDLLVDTGTHTVRVRMCSACTRLNSIASSSFPSRAARTFR